jgi:NAD(P)-dependent dehydrogenase (short-subunit alcohol dehydrogenase family)
MKTYLIIGASSGIGAALATILSAAGNKVIGTYNNTTTYNTELPNLEMHHYDATKSDPLNINIEALDGLVYCPGAINLKPFARTKPEDFIADYELQVVGAIKVIQQFLPVLKKGVNPSILLFSTVASGHGFPFHAIVASSKGAIEGLAKSLAAELSPTVRVNCIAPSLTNTPLAKHLLGTDEKIQANANRHPMKAVGEASDIANMADFLLSDKAKWITGQIIAVDGGMSTLKIG